jgi:chromosome segregation ATPase
MSYLDKTIARLTEELAAQREANTRCAEQCTAYAANAVEMRRERDAAWQKWQATENQLTRVQEALAAFDARKPLPNMSNVALCTLALNHTLNVLDEIRGVVGILGDKR